jgi:hypothetical protein
VKLKKSTVEELGRILKEEFNHRLNKKDLEKLAYSLVGYFSLLEKVENRHKFRNSPAVPIDSSENSVLDNKEVK